ncbi:chemotaxis protein CheC [Acidaminobacterium chupaoyuni]
MPLQDYSELNAIQLDALCEIGNIGSGNAASALSTMLDKPVNIAVPKIKVLDYESVVEQLGGAENALVGLMLSLTGDVTGMIMFLLHKEFAHMVLQELTGGTLQIGTELDEMSRSAIMEVGNIMAASYVNAIASLTGLEINITVPDLCVDMVGAILSVPAIYYADISDKIIFIEDEFNHKTDHAGSHVLLIPETQSLAKIMASLGLDG